ncbi:PAS domain-containing protein, partial [Microcoleus sp. HI-ES]|nr:PAS domain-containing protein [Microcoleus sp. HI-ES]
PLCFAAVIRDVTERKQAERMLREQAEQERLVSAIAQRVRQSLNLTQTLSTAVQEVRQLLATDRTVIYRFESEETAVVVVESVGDDWMPLLGRKVQRT